MQIPSGSFIITPMKDKYSKAIRYFRDNPKKIHDIWNEPYTHKHGCLFAYAEQDSTNHDFTYGCLTMIRRQPFRYHVERRPDLTKKIAADSHIPKSGYDITVGDLKHFARWQRILDKELGRK